MTRLLLCFASPLHICSPTYPSLTYHAPHRMCAPSPPSPFPRRTILRSLSLLPLTLLPTAAAKADALQPPLTSIIMCQRVMRPVSRYIEEGKWDKGRTAVNYCTRVLALRRNMKQAADLFDGDAYYDAVELMADTANTMTQLDATLYTPLFIASDEGINPEQRRYQDQARVFYAEAISNLETFLRLAPENSLAPARHAAENANFQIRIEE